MTAAIKSLMESAVHHGLPGRRMHVHFPCKPRVFLSQSILDAALLSLAWASTLAPGISLYVSCGSLAQLYPRVHYVPPCALCAAVCTMRVHCGPLAV